MIEEQVAVAQPQMPAAPSAGARNYLVLALATISMTSWADRAAFNLLAEPIKRDLGLTDTEIGLLGGLAFAALYALLSIPIARIAERKNRLTITLVAVSLWSFATMVCAFCTNFVQLAFARAVVGTGESACLPCAQSMISDSYPAERRASAISFFSLSIPVGTVVGIIIGAWVAEAYSWRAAFLVVGAPGILLAGIGALTLKEPHRGRYDPPVVDTPPSLTSVIRHLWSRRAFRHLLAGAAVATMLNAGIGTFLAPFVLRGSFGLGLTDLALLAIFLTGVGSFFGVLVSGPLSDRLARRDAKWTLWVPAISLFIATPAWIGAVMANSLTVFVLCALIAQMMMSVYPAPTFGALNNMAEPRMRATAVAIMGVVNGLIGLGLGPLMVGVFSDIAASSLHGAGSATCGQSTLPACVAGSFLGLRDALALSALLYLWPAFHYLRAGSRLKASLIGPGAEHPTAL